MAEDRCVPRVSPPHLLARTNATLIKEALAVMTLGGKVTFLNGMESVKLGVRIYFFVVTGLVRGLRVRARSSARC